MVRRDETERGAARAATGSASRCASPAGESPVPVSAGAPGSRSPSSGRDPDDEAGCRKPLRREQARGPQHQVKPAASTEKQSGSRAVHFTAKATSDEQAPERSSGLGGVEGAARVQGAVRNTRDPSARPQSRQDGSHKPKAKTSVVQRESEGIVVPVIVATKNVTGGKDPCGDGVGEAGKHEGLAA